MTMTLPLFLEALKREIRRYPVHAVAFERGTTDADWEVRCWIDEQHGAEALATWNDAHGEAERFSTQGIALALWSWWMNHALPLMIHEPDARTFLLSKVEGQRLGTGGLRSDPIAV